MQMLRAVVGSGSVTAAAANLGYTPSAVSQQVGVLEKEAGLPLLERVGRGVRPTPAGRLLAGYAAEIGMRMAEAERALAGLRARHSGRVRVRYFATAGAELVAPALAAFRQTHPDVEVELTLGGEDDPLTDVEDDRADLALVVRPRKPSSELVRLVHLVDDPFRAVLPRGHRLASQRVIDLADLAGDPWISSEWPVGPCLGTVLDACGAAGFSPDVATECEDCATALGFVAAGLGISVIPRLGLGGRHAGVAVRRLRRPEPARAVYAAVRYGASAPRALQGLLDCLRTAAVR
ncbi:hypothetical protein N566_18860 [Streptomycetaceae bacterium MP113-05]|nr:hypothetical protein N566_18860 [Streptomycetaceae bacterium MP113-05]